jgi:hypothetical protein
MNWQVLGTDAAELWHHSLVRFIHTDIYFWPEYHRAYELNGDGQARAFIFEAGEHTLFYPFLVRPIEGEKSRLPNELWYDIETVYGYSGPLCTTTEKTFLAEAWMMFAAWCKENRIVAEFIRFNPLIQNYGYVDASCDVRLDRETVAVRLDCSQDDLWVSYPSGHRTKIRKALKSGLVCEEVSLDVGWDTFRRLYRKNMDHVGARQYYYFSDLYFDYLYNTLEQWSKLFIVRDKERVVAAALFFVHGDRIHYHLGGSDLDARQTRPNNLLFHTVATWGRERNLRWLHLGGGRTPESDDSLFRFKTSISRLRLPFYTGKRVHNRTVYEMLCTEWMRRKGVSIRPAYFLLYRL